MSASRPLAALLLAGLLVLAGCSSVTGPSGENATLEPVDGDLPPGVTADGVENRSALLDAHRAALSERGYAMRVGSNVSSGGQNVTTRQRVRVERGLAPFVIRTESDSALRSTRSVIWGNDTTTLVNVTASGQTRYRPFPPTLDVTREVTLSRTLESFLQAGNYTVAGAEERDGRSVVVLRATEPRAVGNATEIRTQNVSAFDATVAVTPDGLVTGYDVRFTAETPRGNASYRASYELARTGDVSVERPAWVGEAVANVTAADLSLAVGGDGAYLELAHEGGDALENGTRLVVDPASGERGQIRLGEAVAPGETRYVYRPANGSAGRFAVAAEAPSNASGQPFDGTSTVVVLAPERYGVANLTATAGGSDESRNGNG